MSDVIVSISVILLAITSILMIVITDWRVRIGLLAIQYFGEFFLISLSWPVAMAVSKLVAGWMAGAVLGMALASNPIVPQEEAARQKPANPPARPARRFPILRLHPASIFYLLSALLVGLFALSVTPVVQSWIPEIQSEQVLAGLLLIGMGILQLGFRGDPFSTILGLLTVLSGFEIIYAAVELSTLVAGLLAAINLSLALVGAFLILAPQLREGE